MRIILIEEGGFVGVPLRYEVDVTSLGARTLGALERALAADGGAGRPVTSAGKLRIRVERDDGSAAELELSQVGLTAEADRVVRRLRACANLLRKA